MRSQGVTRVCCLLDAGQLAGFPVNLEAEYKRLFGATQLSAQAGEQPALAIGAALPRQSHRFVSPSPRGCAAGARVPAQVIDSTLAGNWQTKCTFAWRHGSAGDGAVQRSETCHVM
jgi:hypothetical protein